MIVDSSDCRVHMAPAGGKVTTGDARVCVMADRLRAWIEIALLTG